jgi:uncharacterized protein (DUF1800 family)
MKFLKDWRFRTSSVIFCITALALIFTIPFSAQQPRTSPIAPVKPSLPDGPISEGERLIKKAPAANRNRKTTKPLPLLNEEQKILHLLNRTAFGPRPGDIQRVRQIGIERYLEEQLHPEEMPDEAVTKPLLAISTLQMSIPETMQTFVPPRPTPTPTPTPTPVPAPATAIPAPSGTALPSITGASREQAKDPAQNKEEAGSQGSMPQPKAVMEQATPAAPKPEPARPSNRTPKPKPAPTPKRDPQQPITELQQGKLLRAVFSEKQLQEVMVDFWVNHFNVYAGKDSVRWMVSSYERDVIRPNALGKFKELLVAVAQSPAMLYYLDNYLSQAEVRAGERESERAGDKQKSAASSPTPPLPPSPAPPVRRPGLNENYARELMELHTLGVDGGYTQQDVIEVARCFTGWTVTPQPASAFVFRPRIHDRGEKQVLKTRILAGGGIEDGLRVLDLLAKHPATAKFISYKLCQRFVADEPPAALVERAAEVFKRTEGEIREVVRSILTSPEFYSPIYYRNKIKSPLELTASTIRATGASSDAALPLIQWIAKMGEPLFLCQPPTGYSEDSSRWLSNATLLERMNFAVTLTSNKINGTRVELSRLVESGVVNDRDKLLDQLIAALVHSEISDETRDNLKNAVNESRAKTNTAKYDGRAAQKHHEQLVGGLVALILGSREFQVK